MKAKNKFCLIFRMAERLRWRAAQLFFSALAMEVKSFGEFTLPVVIYDEDRTKVEHAIVEFQKLFTQHEGLLYDERYNPLNAFFATIPGNKQFNGL